VFVLFVQVAVTQSANVFCLQTTFVLLV